MTTYQKVWEFIKRVHTVQPYKRNKNKHRFFIVDLEHDYWFFLFHGENKQLEKLANKNMEFQ